MATTLRKLFNEFPLLPEDLLVTAHGDSSVLNALRLKGDFVLIYVVDGEHSAYSLSGSVSMGTLAANIQGEPPNYLIRDGKVLQYKLVSTITVLDDENGVRV